MRAILVKRHRTIATRAGFCALAATLAFSLSACSSRDAVLAEKAAQAQAAAERAEKAAERAEKAAARAAKNEAPSFGPDPAPQNSNSAEAQAEQPSADNG